MLKIFAKHGTDEKIAVYCTRYQIPSLMQKFENQFGGAWLLVDECSPGDEILKFNDGQIYRGFESNMHEGFRYSKSILKLKS